MAQPIMNFLVNGNDSSELDLPELQDDSDFANLAKYVRRNDQNRDDRRPDRLFGAIATAAPANFDVRLTKKPFRPIVEPTSDNAVVAANDRPDVFAHPQPIHQHRTSALTNARRRSLIKDFVAADEPASAAPLEQTLNVTHFDFDLPQCHSTPHTGPPRATSAPPKRNSIQPQPQPQPTTTAAALPPSNISININLNNPNQPDDVIVESPASTPANPRTSAVRRKSSLPVPTFSTVHERTPEPPAAAASTSSNRFPTRIQSPGFAVPQASAKRAAHQSSPGRSPAAVPHPTTPRPHSKRSLSLRHSVDHRSPLSPLRVLNGSPTNAPDTSLAREELLRVLRQKCHDQERNAANLSAAKQKSKIAAASVAVQHSLPVNEVVVAPSLVDVPVAAANFSAKQRPSDGPTTRPDGGTQIGDRPPSLPTQQQTLFDISQYVQNVNRDDFIREFSPATSQTLRNNMLQNRDRTSSHMSSNSLRTQATRMPRKAPHPSVHEFQLFEQQEVARPVGQSQQRRQLYSKGDSLNGSCDDSGPRRQCRAIVEPDALPVDDSQRPPRRSTTKRRSGEMAASTDTESVPPSKKLSQTHRSNGVLTNSRKPDDSLLTSDDDDNDNDGIADKSRARDNDSSGEDIINTLCELSQTSAIHSQGTPSGRPSRSRQQSARAEVSQSSQHSLIAAKVLQDWTSSEHDSDSLPEPGRKAAMGPPLSSKWLVSPSKNRPRPKCKPCPLSRKPKYIRDSLINERSSDTDCEVEHVQRATTKSTQKPHRSRIPTKMNAVVANATERKCNVDNEQQHSDEPRRREAAERRATYTKSSAKGISASHEDNERHQKASDRRGTYTKSSAEGFSASPEEPHNEPRRQKAAERRGTYTKSPAEAASAPPEEPYNERRPQKAEARRGTYTKSSAERNSASPEEPNNERRPQKAEARRGTYTKASEHTRNQPDRGTYTIRQSSNDDSTDDDDENSAVRPFRKRAVRRETFVKPRSPSPVVGKKLLRRTYTKTSSDDEHADNVQIQLREHQQRSFRPAVDGSDSEVGSDEREVVAPVRRDTFLKPRTPQANRRTKNGRAIAKQRVEERRMSDSETDMGEDGAVSLSCSPPKRPATKPTTTKHGDRQREDLEVDGGTKTTRNLGNLAPVRSSIKQKTNQTQEDCSDDSDSVPLSILQSSLRTVPIHKQKESKIVRHLSEDTSDSPESSNRYSPQKNETKRQAKKKTRKPSASSASSASSDSQQQPTKTKNPTHPKSVRTVRSDRYSTDVEHFPSSYHKRTQKDSDEDYDYVPGKSIRERTDRPPDSRSFERSTRTTYNNVNMSLASNRSSNSDSGESYTLAPATQTQSKHQRTVYQNEDVNETVPETQASQVYDNIQADEVNGVYAEDGDDTDANMHLRMDDSDVSSSQHRYEHPNGKHPQLVKPMQESTHRSTQQQSTHISTQRNNNSSGNSASIETDDGKESFKSCSTATSRRSFSVVQQSSDDRSRTAPSKSSKKPTVEESHGESDQADENGSIEVAAEIIRKKKPTKPPAAGKGGAKKRIPASTSNSSKDSLPHNEGTSDYRSRTAPSKLSKKPAVEESHDESDHADENGSIEVAAEIIRKKKPTKPKRKGGVKKRMSASTSNSSIDSLQHIEGGGDDSLDSSKSGTSSNANGKRRYRRKQDVPTMNSYDYKPLDRVPDDDPNLRRSKRGVRPRIKYWKNEDEPWSPLIIYSHAALTKSTKPRNVNRVNRTANVASSIREDSSHPTSSAIETTNSTIGNPMDSILTRIFEARRNRSDALRTSTDLDGVEFAVGDHLEHIRHGGVEYWHYPSNESDARGYIRLQPHSEKKRCRTHEKLELVVLHGVMTVMIENRDATDVLPGSLIMIPCGKKYGIRNQTDGVLELLFCKRTTTTLDSISC